MNFNIETNGCDPAQMDSFLNRELNAAEEDQFTAHLNNCPNCRVVLEQKAAEPADWTEAERLLKPSPFDEPSGEPRSQRQPPQIHAVLEALSPTDDPHMLGRLGGYEVSGVIGSGGMGVVLKAHDPALDRTVAIKVLSPHLAASGAARKRFAREAKAAAAVLHPNVIAIHSVPNDGPLPYLVMPYLRGSSLQKRLDEEGPLALHEILRIGSQIAAGLAAAHAQGLVHRDIKPANILLEEGIERVTITDFGLARAVDDATITRSGVIAGTPQFMSPEQARGEAVDHRSDLFSLGALLYTLCTARPPFRAETPYGVICRINDEQPRAIREINPDIPEWLCVLIARLMAKRPADRFESAEDVAELLEDCLAHVQQPAVMPLPACLETETKRSPSSQSPRNIKRKGILAMIGTVSLTLLGMVCWQATQPPDIAGTWSSETWGKVALKQADDGEYKGTYSQAAGEQPGTLTLNWSRIERRFNGTWREGKQGKARFGEISLRLVDGKIRGAYTTDRGSKINPATPRLADLLWVKSTDAGRTVRYSGVVVHKGQPVEGAVARFYLHHRYAATPLHLWKKTTTGADGRFVIEGTIDDEQHVDLNRSKIAISAPGLASLVGYWKQQEAGRKNLIKMAPAASITGRVTDSKSRPVAGAYVRVGSHHLAGVHDDVTDAQGRFEIDDLVAGVGKFFPMVGIRNLLTVTHPRDDRQIARLTSVPSTVEMVFQPRSTDDQAQKIAADREVPEATASDVYHIAANDVLGIYIENILGDRGTAPRVNFPEDSSQEPSIGFPIPVQENGTIVLPLVDPIPVAGLTIAQATEAIHQAYTVDRKILKPDADHIVVTLMRRRPVDSEAPKTRPRAPVDPTRDRLWNVYGVTPKPVSDTTAKVLEFIGLHLSPITKSSFREKNVFADYAGGLEVKFFRNGGPAHKAGFVSGPAIVVKLQSQTTLTLDDLDAAMKLALEQIKKGEADALHFDVLINGKTVRHDVTVPVEQLDSPAAGGKAGKSKDVFSIPHEVPFEIGASNLRDGDRITIKQVRGTAKTIQPGQTYEIQGTYKLASHDKAKLAAFVTAMNSEGKSQGRDSQTMTVDRGEGTFSLRLRIPYKGKPHVSFYSLFDGEGFGGVYFGTGDSVLKHGWWEEESIREAPKQ